MRTLPLTMTNALNAERTADHPILLLEIWHPSVNGGAHMYLSSDPTTFVTADPPTYKTTHLAVDYIFLPMFIQMPDDVPGRATRARIGIQNISRELVALARSVSTRGYCDMTLLMRTNLAVKAINYPTFRIRNVQGNETVISWEFGIDGMDDEPVPAGLITPAGFPNSFM